MSKRNAVVFDLDGVLACNKHRLDHLRKFDYEKYNKLCLEDPVLENNVKLLKYFHENRFLISILTGRPRSLSQPSLEWLKKNKIPFDYFSPRPDLQGMSGFKMKSLIRMRGHMNISFFFDDDPENISDAISIGITAIYIHSGYYDQQRVPWPTKSEG